MTDELTKRQWAELVVYLSATIGRPMPGEQAKVYYDLLKDIPFATLQFAVKRAVQEMAQNFIPTVGKIREYAAEYAVGQLPLAAEAWTAVLKAIKRFGYVRRAEALQSLDPVAAAAADSIGWDTLCDSENISILSGQFRMAYEAIAKRFADRMKLSVELRPAITGRPQKSIANPAITKLIDHFKIPEE